MAYFSSPGFKGIFVGDRPLGLTRLNRNEPGAFVQSPESNEKENSSHRELSHYRETRYPIEKYLTLTNLLSTEREDRTGEYWPDRGYQCGPSTARSLLTKAIEDQYSSVRLEQGSKFISYVHGTREHSKTKMTRLMTVSMESSLGRNPDQNRTN